ncbi:chromophore lyase CpcT/CpeT [Thermoleptolyngbya sp. C42_A2020_037]|uniref:chromophore lyase CpcT/CpeT n=1 Tax=Thermoleptolyngbya sp. C42_A2020_037 TaxID=2747799 RepID=UPI0019E90878|nr:chromophore lyase CpcT/CpeT [Thermoleptolyngbya sp. C42_A2020_037]MBF2086474.1 chromophore lyase CpcT/CpeT [Thermoleptolyngbya sp. C42_A2020_037]
MPPVLDLLILAQWLAGEFDNRAQSLDQPAWFVHLRLWHRPLPIRINGCLALFAEQANALYLQNPYRQRVLVLQENSDGNTNHVGDEADGNPIVQYWAFRQPDRFRGAGARPDLLSNLTLDDLQLLPGCRLRLRTDKDGVAAEPKEGDRCCFQYNGETRQVVLGFEVSPGRFRSYDKGVDPDTGQALWGALMGPYEFIKQVDYPI